MASLFCTGPCHAFIGGAGSTGQYLGTCEDAPEIELRPEYEGVRNDLGGKKKPFDMQFQGEDAMISLDLNHYNETAYQVLANRPRTFAAGLPLGTNGPADVGSLIQTEGLQMQLWLLFAFGANGAAPKAAYTANGMPPGYHFYSVVPIEPERLTVGNKPKKVHVMLYAYRLWVAATQSFVLYDFNLTDAGAIN